MKKKRGELISNHRGNNRKMRHTSTTCFACMYADTCTNPKSLIYFAQERCARPRRGSENARAAKFNAGLASTSVHEFHPGGYKQAYSVDDGRPPSPPVGPADDHIQLFCLFHCLLNFSFILRSLYKEGVRHGSYHCSLLLFLFVLIFSSSPNFLFIISVFCRIIELICGDIFWGA